MSPGELLRVNPNTGTCPVFRTAVDAELTRKIYERVPVLGNERTGEDPWDIRFMTMFHMSNDSNLFYSEPSAGRVPLYEAKLIHHFDHRWATYEGGVTRDFRTDEKADIIRAVPPRYWWKRGYSNRLPAEWGRRWFMGFRGIARRGRGPSHCGKFHLTQGPHTRPVTPYYTALRADQSLRLRRTPLCWETIMQRSVDPPTGLASNRQLRSPASILNVLNPRRRPGWDLKRCLSR